MKSLFVGIALSAMASTAALANLHDQSGAASGSGQQNNPSQVDTRGNVVQRDWKQGRHRREPRHKICSLHHNRRLCRWSW